MLHRIPFHRSALLALAPLSLLIIGCTSKSSDKDIPEPAIRTFTATPATITSGGSVKLTANFAVTNGAGTGTVQPGNITIYPNLPVTVSNITQTTTYTLTVTASSGKAVTATTTVTVSQPPNATITAPESATTGQAGLIASVPAQTGATYAWTVTNGTITAGATSNSATFTAGSAGADGSASKLTLSCKVTNASGQNTTGTKEVVVKAQAPAGLSYSLNPANYFVNAPITPNAPSFTGGGPVQGFAVTPALPAGLLMDPQTGIISGIPTVVTPQTTYTVSATNSGGSATLPLIIAVVPQPSVSFTATPAKIAPGGTSILSWKVDASVSSVSIDQSVPGPFAIPEGTKNVSPASTTTYTLTANLAGGGTVQKQATVTVDTTAFKITEFKADQTIVPFGGNTTLRWSYVGIPLGLELDGENVLDKTSAVVYPVRSQRYTLIGAAQSGIEMAVEDVFARGQDLVAGSIAGAGSVDSTNPKQAQFNGQQQIARDAAGNLYVADSLNHTIRMISAGGAVTTIAGMPGLKGNRDSKDGAPLFNTPRGITVASDGSAVFVLDNVNNAVRKLTKSGNTWEVSTLVGTGLSAGYGQIRIDPSNQFLVVADSTAAVMRVVRISDGQMGLYAGTVSSSGHVNVSNASFSTAKFSSPEGIAFNKAGTYFYVTEYGNNAIRMVQWITPPTSGALSTPTGNIFTIAGQLNSKKGYKDGSGNDAKFNQPVGIDVDANDVVWVADTSSSVIRTLTAITPGNGTCTVATVAGTKPTGTEDAPVAVKGSDDGAALSAKFDTPYGLLCSGSKVYVSDTNNASIRLLDGEVSTPIGTSKQSGTTDAVGTAARFNAPQGVASFDGNAYVADTGNKSLRKVSLKDGATTTVATGFAEIKGVAVDRNGNVYVTDKGSSPALSVVQVSPDGKKTTILNGFTSPQNVTVHPTNPNLLYVVDNHSIKEVTVVRDANGGFVSASVTKTIGAASSSGYKDDPDPANARFSIGNYFAGIAVDPMGNIFVSDEGNSCVRKIAAGTYATSTVAGIGKATGITNYGFLDGALGTNKFNYTMGLVVDSTGNLYVADQGNHAIRKVATNGSVTTLIGQSFVDPTLAPNGVPIAIGAKAGGIGAGASLNKPMGLAITDDGHLLVTTNNGLMQITAP